MISWFYPWTDIFFQLSILNYLWKSSFLKTHFSLTVRPPIEFGGELRSNLNSGYWTCRGRTIFRRSDFNWFLASQQDSEKCVSRFELSAWNCLESSILLKIWYSSVVGLPIGFAENDSHSQIPHMELAMTEHFVQNSNSIGPWPANRISTQSNPRFEFAT